MSQALQENGSTLASMVGSLPKWLKEWESDKLSPESSYKLYSPYPLQMHAKFWGKSMADEEQKCNAQSPTSMEGSSLENELQGEAMDVDVTVSEEDQDDIMDGCYFLELDDIEDLNIHRIWIRAEYIRIYDALEAFYQYPRRRAPAAVITGQPGIGES
jgi:hypothetical protein